MLVLHVRADAWQEVERFWLSVARYILHAPTRTPISAIVGDLNWLPFSVRSGQQVMSFWSRVTKMDDTCLVRKAMHVQRELVSSKQPCWLANLNVLISSYQDYYLDHVWNGWISNTPESRFYTRIMCIKRLRFDGNVNNMTVPLIGRNL